MNKASDAILGRARVREVAGVFHSYEALDAAVEGLLLAGFDRADIDRMAPIDEVRDKVGAVYIASEELADVPHAPRQPIVLPADTGATTALVASVAAGAAGLGMALVAVMLDYTLVQGAVAALIVAIVAGGVAAIATLRIFKREKITGLDTFMTERGIVLWVRVRTPEREEIAQKVLSDHGARAIRVHEIEIDKTAEDLPLSKLRPDPWLANERLGGL
jgi:hypothetical protein